MTRQGKKRLKRFIIILLTLAVLGAAAFGIYIWYEKKVSDGKNISYDLTDVEISEISYNFQGASDAVNANWHYSGRIVGAITVDYSGDWTATLTIEDTDNFVATKLIKGSGTDTVNFDERFTCIGAKPQGDIKPSVTKVIILKDGIL